MKKILLFFVCSFTCLLANGQTDTIEIVFEKFYEIREGLDKKHYYSILYDSTFYTAENLTFIRILQFNGFEKNNNSLIPGKKYKLIIARKYEHGIGCQDQILNFRSNRTQTDPGTLFGSDFLEKLKEEKHEESCNYKAIEYYQIKGIIKNGG